MLQGSGFSIMIIQGKGRLWLQLNSYSSMSECKSLAEPYGRTCMYAPVPDPRVLAVSSFALISWITICGFFSCGVQTKLKQTVRSALLLLS